MIPPLATPVLFIDAASSEIAVGVRATASANCDWQRSHAEAGAGVFGLVEDALGQAGVTIAGVQTIVFCEGPGSILGIRVAAMAVRAWCALRPDAPPTILAYRSLELLAVDLMARGTRPPFVVLSDARRHSWNLLEVDRQGALGAIRRVEARDGLPTGFPAYHPASFPHWQPLPNGVETVSYRPEVLPQLLDRQPLLRRVERPDSFMIEAPEYRKWTPVVGNRTPTQIAT